MGYWAGRVGSCTGIHRPEVGDSSNPCLEEAEEAGIVDWVGHSPPHPLPQDSQGSHHTGHGRAAVGSLDQSIGTVDLDIGSDTR